MYSSSLISNKSAPKLQKNLRWPGIEPGSTAWKATMLTITPPSQLKSLGAPILKQFILLQNMKIIKFKKNSHLRWPGIEPGSTAWKATMLTITPPSQTR
ncbi:hypothetical protein KPH14_004669 [Odynerus spinipes]|uniref:Uncharacterized protein n=1 Tax=Odynerus spinipes TaxID=1348599 RepID=A0AAD9VQG6_9HYME|nr:hypothetical protein KPH14_004669 [Odynerus spinipes]